MEKLSEFDALELGKQAGWYLETTHTWSYGEGCSCGCKYVASSAHVAANLEREEKHFKSLRSAISFFKSEDESLREPRLKFAAEQAAQYEQLKLWGK